jgi:hypothetical protein
VTQTLHLIYAVATLHRILRPGGVVLATFPGISQVSGGEWSRTWSWGFDSRLAHRLFANCFGEHNVTVEAHGNSLTAVAFLQGSRRLSSPPRSSTPRRRAASCSWPSGRSGEGAWAPVLRRAAAARAAATGGRGSSTTASESGASTRGT